MYVAESNHSHGTACSFSNVPIDDRRRVFILGPSHHAYLDGCALTKCGTYATPVGDLPVDRESKTNSHEGVVYND